MANRTSFVLNLLAKATATGSPISSFFARNADLDTTTDEAKWEASSPSSLSSAIVMLSSADRTETDLTEVTKPRRTWLE